MQLKRFVGDSTPATLNAVRKAFGDEALILSNRKVGNQVEIIATGELDEAALVGASTDVEVAELPGYPSVEKASPTQDNRASAGQGLASTGDDGPDDGGPAASLARANASPGACHEIPLPSVPAGADGDRLVGDAADLLEAVAGAVSGAADNGGDSRQAHTRIAHQAEEQTRKHRSLRERAGDLLKSQRKAREQEIASLADDIVTLSGVAPVTLGQPGNANDEAGSGPRDFADIQARVVQEQDSRSADAVESGAAPGPSVADISAIPGDATPALRADQVDALSAGVVQAVEELLARQAEAMEHRFQRLEATLWGSQDKVRAGLVRQMMHLGLGAELSVRLVERLKGDASEQAMIRECLSLLKSSLPIATDHSISEPGVTVLSGPAGSGKTTALVKLATQFVKANGNQSIVMICADARRIGAFDLLQTYGRLLSIPVVQAHDSDELANLISAFAHKSLVLVDHTMPGTESALELPALPMGGAIEGADEKPGHDTLRHLLVLPATLQAAAAESIVASIAGSTIGACVLTQLDQCTRLGELFGALIRHHLRVAYWCDTAQVQQPLHQADASILVATAMAMGRRVPHTPDDQWLQNLLQPARHGLPLAI